MSSHVLVSVLLCALGSLSMSREKIVGGLYTYGTLVIRVPNPTLRYLVPLSYPYHPQAWETLDVWECGTAEVEIGGRKSTVNCNQAKTCNKVA